MPDNLGYSIFLDPADTVRVWQERDRLQPTVDWSEMRHENHASAFTIAKIAKLDLLRYMRSSLDNAIRFGGTFESWQKTILPELQKQGWWGAVTNPDLTGTADTIFVGERRLRTIYDTNVRMSLASGAWVRIQRQKDVYPYLRYLPSTSEHKRPLHKLWYGVILPVDHPWWATHFPPNGWMCKCHYEQVSQRRMRQKGWSVTPEADIPGHGEFTDWHPATGETIQVPAGIDPGFGYNPGIAHLRVVANKAAVSIQQAVDAGLIDEARQTLRELVSQPELDQFLALPDPAFPVMILDDLLRDAIGAQTRVAVLSRDTVVKQVGKRTLPVTVYRRLPDMVDQAEIIARDGDNVLIFARAADGKWTVAVVKRTASGQGLFLTSLREQNDASLPRLLKGTEIIVDRR